MRETLPIALKLMFGHEGGYSNAKTDKGNYLNGVLVGTKYGITGQTLAAYRNKPVSAGDVRALSLDEAEAIYHKNYWVQAGGDMLPVGLDYAVFDTGVMSGPARAVRILQQVVGTRQDGNVGVQTLEAVKNYRGGIKQLIRDYCDARMAFLRGIDGAQGWSANCRGWERRVTGIDPKGVYKPEPGVIGNALTLADNSTQPGPLTTPNPVVPDPAPIDTGAKAEPAEPNPWLKPDVLGPVGGAIGGLGTIAAGSGPVQIALGVAIVVAAIVGGYFAFKTIRAQVV